MSRMKQNSLYRATEWSSSWLWGLELLRFLESMRMMRSDLHDLQDPWEKHNQFQQIKLHSLSLSWRFKHHPSVSRMILWFSQTHFSSFSLSVWFTLLFSGSSHWQTDGTAFTKHLKTLIFKYCYIYSEILQFRPLISSLNMTLWQIDTVGHSLLKWLNHKLYFHWSWFLTIIIWFSWLF